MVGANGTGKSTLLKALFGFLKPHSGRVLLSGRDVTGTMPYVIHLIWANPTHSVLFWAAVGGAGITAFYMFRLWYMTFIGAPRDAHVYEHAHESPRSMVVPLVILAALALGAGWKLWPGGPGLEPLLEQARPQGFENGATVGWTSSCVIAPPEHLLHTPELHQAATWWAFSTALAGFLLATAFYGVRWLNPEAVRRRFAPLYTFLVHKWYFDELYGFLWVRPVLRIAQFTAAVDKQGIDRLADGAQRDRPGPGGRLDRSPLRRRTGEPDGPRHPRLGPALAAPANGQRAAVRDVAGPGHRAAFCAGQLFLELAMISVPQAGDG